MTALKASVSASTALTNQSLSVCPRSPIRFIAGRRPAIPFLVQVSAATMLERAAEREPQRAATLPPPGAGESLDSSSANSMREIAFSPAGAPR